MKRNFVQLFTDCIAKNEFAQPDSFPSRDFNFIRYANYATYDITAHNNFSKIIHLQRDRYLPHEH